MFGILVFIAVLMGIAALYMYIKLKSTDKVFIRFSEKVGDKVIEHKETYIGMLDYKKDLMNISKLKLKRPIPPRDMMVSTKNGDKLVYLIKFDNFRYAFRVPALHNEVMTIKRDHKGNIILKDEKPIYIKKKWLFCENVIEPDVIHWEEAELIKNRERHQIRANLWDKWGAPISMALIFLFAIISMNMLTKEWKMNKEAIMEKADETQAQAERTQDNLNNLMEKMTGQRIFKNEQPTTPIQENVTQP